MASLRSLINTLTTTKNFTTALSLKTNTERKTIRFRNGSIITPTWTEYCKFRDFFAQKKYKQCIFTQNGNQYTVESPGFKLTGSYLNVPDMFETCMSFQNLPSMGYKVTQENDVFIVEGKGMKLVGSSLIIAMMPEFEQGTYQYNYQGKTVLDVGGFQGETAVYFSTQGAKKVVIYEPVPSHQEFIKKNVALNNVNAEIHQEGLGSKNGSITVSFDKIDFGFGSQSTGQFELKIKTKEASELIAESKADIAKIDCEGAEEALLDVDAQTLRSVEYYMIEVHSKDVRSKIIEKFLSIQFELVKEIKTPQPDISVIHFKRL